MHTPQIIAKCVQSTRNGLLQPGSVLGIQHLIVDEYQDLNNCDIEFVESILDSDTPANVFVLGDDDQSVYSFRFAYPLGIQEFNPTQSHALTECFRCTPAILRQATLLIEAFSMRKRLPKTLTSVYKDNEGVEGIIHGFEFASEQQEANSVAASCRKLIEAGVAPECILVLISNRDVQLKALRDAFVAEDVEADMPTGERFIDTEIGRYVHALLRVACDIDLRDYVAHRLVFGLPNGIGLQTCIGVRNKVIDHNLRYLEIFYYDLPQGVFSGRELTAINRARGVFTELQTWTEEDTVSSRTNAIERMLHEAFGDQDVVSTTWQELVSLLPGDMNLGEIRDWLSTQNRQQQAQVLERVYERLGLQIPEGGFISPAVQVMTMHGAKGLNARVVFIPGLEDRILPGDKRRPYPGLVLEAARMLYVSITRASTACILSYSTSRGVWGRREFQRTASDFLTSLEVNFTPQSGPLTDIQVQRIVENVRALEFAEQKLFSES